MFDVQTTELFDQWLSDLTNRAARTRIASRIDRLSWGNPGDVNAVGEGISEMRIDTGPGYRVYYKQTGRTIILILCGGINPRRTRISRRQSRSQRGFEGKRKW
jgi:putative addiction module killer protein